jgi:heme-degrading monooxygenase HmoA
MRVTVRRDAPYKQHDATTGLASNDILFLAKGIPMNDWRWWLAGCGLILPLGMVLVASAMAAEPPARVLRHVVMYKFKDSVKPAEIDEAVAAFNAMPGKIDTIIGYEHGTNVSNENKSEGLTHCFVVSFKSEKDRDAYHAHPAHAEYVKVVKDRREKVVVFDYWAPDGK